MSEKMYQLVWGNEFDGDTVIIASKSVNKLKKYFHEVEEARYMSSTTKEFFQNSKWEKIENVWIIYDSERSFYYAITRLKVI